jgi:hypothetical protein
MTPRLPSFPSLDRVVALMRARRFVVFTRGDLNLNLVGVRTHGRKAGAFDDWLVVFYKVGGVWRYHAFEATTDPGGFYLEEPLDPEGCAIMAPGQYRRAYKVGQHRGRAALVNRGAGVETHPAYFRDDTRDEVLDLNPERLVEGDSIGLHIHDAGELNDAGRPVDRWSAGCQVLAHAEDLELLLYLCKRSAKLYGPVFSYTLIDL